MTTHRTILLLAAAPKEAESIAAAWPNGQPPREDGTAVHLDARFVLIRTGVGKVNAALGAARHLMRGEVGTVLNLGICGGLAGEGRPSPKLGDVVLASASVYADEGLALPDPDLFRDMTSMGFPLGGARAPGPVFEAEPELVERLARLLPKADLGPVATVSTCSGTDRHAREVAARTGALAEAMEGAAIAHALSRMAEPPVPFAEIRVVSNTTGDRPRQRWDLPGALRVLTEVAGALRNGL